MNYPQKYKLEFLLHTYNTSAQAVKNALAEFVDSFKIADSSKPQGKGSDFLVNISTEDPELVFDICSQLGRIRSVKIDEENG
jgi:dihydroxyacetone kinase-like predicted kinase